MFVDLLIKNIHVFNSYYKKFSIANVAVRGNKIFYVGPRADDCFTAKERIDGTDRYLIPGLIDIHLHVESSMVTPETFSFGLIQNGVTTVIPEPHEMANVFGIKGVQAMIAASKACVADMFYAIPSSVPPTALETNGGNIDVDEIDQLMKEGKVTCLGEVMNYVDILNKPDCKTNRILHHIKKYYPDLVIEGHVPKLLDLELNQVLAAGVDSDHTLQTVTGLKARIQSGMFVEIQEKSMKQDIIDYLITHDIKEHFCFVTDDVMMDSFTEKGHLNHLIKKAISMGMSPIDAIYAGTFTPARRMKLTDRGSIAPGRLADFVILSSLKKFVIDAVYKKGRKVFAAQHPIKQKASVGQFPPSFYHSVKIFPLSARDFSVKHQPDGTYQCRIMEINDGTTFTKEKHRDLAVNGSLLQWEKSPYALIAVFERYGKNGNRGYGLAGGDTIKQGAMATTYAHDSHNLMVIGQNAADMVLAANHVINQQGGICVVNRGKIIAFLHLPIGGILTEAPFDTVGKKVAALRRAMRQLGYVHYNPIMSFCTNSLAVSPALKITDFGLVDVNQGKIVPLIIGKSS
jgi:adenine deaminase